LLTSYVSFNRLEIVPFVALNVVGLILAAVGSVGEDKFDEDVLDENEEDGE